VSSLRDRLTGRESINWRDVAFFVLSLLIAFGLWLISNLSLYYTRTVRIPVIAQCAIEGHAPQSSNTAFLEARCRVTGFSILRMNAYGGHPVVVGFSPSDMHPSTGDNFYVTNTELNAYVQQLAGSDSHLEAFISDTLVFRFPSENHKKVPVQPVYSLSFEPQYTAAGPLKLVPDSVVVYGEQYHLDKIDRVYTESFSLSDLHDGGASGSVGLQKIKGVRLSDENVSYSMEAARFVEIRLQMPVTGRNVPTDRQLIIHPSTATVSFRCAFPVKVDPEQDVRFYIEYNDFTSSLGGKCIPRNSALPDGILSFTIEPEVFECVESVR